MSDAFKEYENGKTVLGKGVVSSSLLDCPFCDMHDLFFIEVRNPLKFLWFVQCMRGARGPTTTNKNEAVKAWNTRPV